MQINWEEQLGSETDSEIQDFSVGNQRLKTYGYKERWRLWWPEKLPVSQESPLEDPLGPRMYTNPSTWGSAPEGCNSLVGSGGSN